jgi:uncharacterized protein (DUF58 family)
VSSTPRRTAREPIERVHLATFAKPPQQQPTAPSATPTRRLVRGRGYDRVGGGRLTGFGTVVLFAVVAGAAAPPQASDRQVMVVIWLGLLAVFVLGVAWPMLSVRRIRVAVTAPRDAIVGQTVPLTLTLTGAPNGCEVRSLDPTGPWHRAVDGDGELGHRAERRGLFQVVRVEVRVTAPLGILAAHRVHSVPLPVAVEVAPVPLAIAWLPAAAPVAGQVMAASVGASSGDVVRSVRPYQQGDPAHLVHWASTARTGDLVVRELEPPVPVGQAIVVDLRDLGVDTERGASYALGAANAVLAAGGELVLATCEAAGPVVGRVRTPLDAGRRLARSVGGPPGTPPTGWPVVEIGR